MRKFITLSNHFPYPIDKEEATIEPANTGDSSVDTYFQTARYLDESVKGFIDYLKQSGLYDNSIIVMYGDHYGISDNHNAAMSKVMGKEINSFENAQLQRVPLIVRVPGVKVAYNINTVVKLMFFQLFYTYLEQIQRLCSIWFRFIITRS
ncbi:sulfatase-like hydrolase/transferase [Bacillus pacificus]